MLIQCIFFLISYNVAQKHVRHIYLFFLVSLHLYGTPVAVLTSLAKLKVESKVVNKPQYLEKYVWGLASIFLLIF